MESSDVVGKQAKAIIIVFSQSSASYQVSDVENRLPPGSSGEQTRQVL